MMRPLAKNFYLERLNLNSNLKRGSCPVAVATLLMRQESDVYCDKAQCRLATRTAQQSDISMEQEVRLPRTWCGGVQLTSSNDDCCTAASVTPLDLLYPSSSHFSSTITWENSYNKDADIISLLMCPRFAPLKHWNTLESEHQSLDGVLRAGTNLAGNQEQTWQRQDFSVSSPA